MAGNVWEWTRSLRERYPFDPSGGREDLEAGRGVRVLRGGAFNDGVKSLRCAFRYRMDPNNRNWYSGFRVVAAPVGL